MTARSHSRSYSRFKKRRAKGRRNQGVPRRDLRDNPRNGTPELVDHRQPARTDRRPT